MAMELRTETKIETIERTLRLFVQPGADVEIRAIGVQSGDGSKPHPVSRICHSIEEAATFAAALDGTAKGVYFTLNELNPGVTRSAVDKDVARRRWFPIDLDVERPTETSSSSEERKAAFQLGARIRDRLTQMGWPEPVIGDSGNGCHLVYSIDLDANDKGLVKRALEALDFLYSDGTVKVDTVNHNQSRIWKLYGTQARKGVANEERPHRVSRLVKVPAQVEVVTTAQLEALSAYAPNTKEAVLEKDAKGKAIDLAAWLERHGIEVERMKKTPGETTYRLVSCPWADEHSEDEGGAAAIQYASGAVWFKCHHSHCEGRGWREFRLLYEPNAYDKKPAMLDLAASLTDVGNASRFVAQHRDVARYCFTWRCWLIWDGIRWVKDSAGHAVELAKLTAQSIFREASEANDERDAKTLGTHARNSMSKTRLDAMLALAQSELPISADQLDCDKWLLNVQNGTLNLRTGRLQPHGQDDLITKLAPVTYDPDAAAPVFEAFLSDIMKGNSELVAYLQQFFGLCLTGDISEHMVNFFYGSGSNGKGTLVETLAALMGDYATATQAETIMAKDRDGGIPNDIARLKGARLVFASETEQDKRLAESKLKQLVGGDTVTARFLHGEFFDFKPEFKLVVYTNHRPFIKGQDEGIWRRIRLVPFTLNLAEADRDLALPDKLTAEFSGILAWAVQGCLAWQKQGRLVEPESVVAATKEYREEMDIIGGFLEDTCEKDASYRVTTKELYAAYQTWVRESGEYEITNRQFNAQVKERFGESYRGTGNKPTWRGLRVRKESQGHYPRLLA